MKIAVLIKQVPAAEAADLGEDGRLRRKHAGTKINSFCRWAVSKGLLESPPPRLPAPPQPPEVVISPVASSLRELAVHCNDQVGDLAGARATVGLGGGAAEHEMSLLQPLRAFLSAEVGGTGGVDRPGAVGQITGARKHCQLSGQSRHLDGGRLMVCRSYLMKSMPAEGAHGEKKH